MLRKLLRFFFSIKNEKYHRVVTIFGIKIKYFRPLTGGVYFCPVCNRYGRFMDMVGKPRFAVKCPYCRSLERHRFLFFIYKKYFLNTRKPIRVLHTAPEKCICDLIGRYPLVDYVPMDLSPERYRFCRCRKEDVTNLSFADNTIDVVLSNQVMEHIMDESKFLTELLRVLKPGGLFLLNFPVYMGLEKTFQDNSITSPEEREKYYGQHDHVRAYGRDIFSRLKAQYNAEVIFAKDCFSKRRLAKMRITNEMTDFCVIIRKQPPAGRAADISLPR